MYRVVMLERIRVSVRPKKEPVDGQNILRKIWGSNVKIMIINVLGLLGQVAAGSTDDSP